MNSPRSADEMHEAYMDLMDRFNQALDLAFRYGGIPESHHKAWVIDQMVRALAGKHYTALIQEACGTTHTWDEGIAP